MIQSRSLSPSTLASKKLQESSRKRDIRFRISKLLASPPSEKQLYFGTSGQARSFTMLSHGQTHAPKLSFGNSSTVKVLKNFKASADYLFQPIHHHSSSRGCSVMWKRYVSYTKQVNWCLAPSIHGCCTI